MSLLIQKFGGTSVGSIERIQHVANIIAQTRAQGHDVVAVVSAMSGETDRLISLAKAMQPDPNAREYAMIVSTGEQVTIGLLALALQALGFKSRSYTGAQIGVRTSNHHKSARILHIDDNILKRDLAEGYVPVIAGFQGCTESGDITTLGRGGSDTSAVALAAAIKADECQIYTDVDGVYTTDPRVVPEARRLDHLTFEEMLEMASLGAKVLQIRSVEFASKFNVPVRVLSSFTEGEGTLITFEQAGMEQPLLSGIAFSRDEAKLTVAGIPNQSGIAAQILGPISQANINVDIIVQTMAANGMVDFSFTVPRDDYEKALQILEPIAQQLQAATVLSDNKVAKLSLIGVGMRSHAGIASKMFEVLSNEGIHIELISTSEIKISVIIDEKYLELGARVLHAAFGLDK